MYVVKKHLNWLYFLTVFPRLIILIEDDCGATGFKLLAEITPDEDFLYPIPEIDKEGAKQYTGKNYEQHYEIQLSFEM